MRPRALIWVKRRLRPFMVLAKQPNTQYSRLTKKPRRCAGAKALLAGDKQLISSEPRLAPRNRRSGS